jgi:hypothetical protein
LEGVLSNCRRIGGLGMLQPKGQTLKKMLD